MFKYLNLVFSINLVIINIIIFNNTFLISYIENNTQYYIQFKNLIV